MLAFYFMSAYVKEPSYIYLFVLLFQADSDVDQFLEEEHNFDDYEREVKKYNRLFNEIQYNSIKVQRLGMFEVHCEELIRGLAKRAEGLKDKLLKRMSHDHQQVKNVCVCVTVCL